MTKSPASPPPIYSYSLTANYEELNLFFNIEDIYLTGGSGSVTTGSLAKGTVTTTKKPALNTNVLNQPVRDVGSGSAFATSFENNIKHDLAAGASISIEWWQGSYDYTYNISPDAKFQGSKIMTNYGTVDFSFLWAVKLGYPPSQFQVTETLTSISPHTLTLPGIQAPRSI